MSSGGISFNALVSRLGYLTIGNAISAIIGGILLLLLASMLSVEQYGELGFHISLATIASTASIFGINLVIVTQGARQNESFVNAATSLILIIGVGLAIPIAIWNWAVAALYLGMVYFIVSSAILLASKSNREFAIVLIGSKALQFLLAILLLEDFGVTGVIIAYAIGFLAFSYRFFVKLRNFSLEFGLLKKEAKLIFNSSTISFAQSASSSLDKIFIAPIFGLIFLANYQLGYQFLLFLSILPGSIFQFLLSHESTTKIQLKTKIILLSASGIVAIIFVVSIPSLIDWLFPKYHDAIDSIQIIGLGIIPLTVISMAHSLLLNSSKSNLIAVGESVYIGSQLVFIYILGTMLQNIGIAYALLFSFIFQAAFLTLVLKKQRIQAPNST